MIKSATAPIILGDLSINVSKTDFFTVASNFDRFSLFNKEFLYNFRK